MGEQGAVEILYAKETRDMTPEEKHDFLQEKAREYRHDTMNSRLGLQRGYITEEIQPIETRAKLIETLARLGPRAFFRRALKRHGNIPL